MIRRTTHIPILTLFSYLMISNIFPAASQEVSLDSLYSVYNNTQDDSLKAIFTNKLGRHYFFRNTDSSFYYLSEALEQSNDLIIPMYLHMLTYLRLGDFYSIASDPNHGIDFYLDGLKIAERDGIDRIKASIWNNLGITYSQIDQYDKALEYTRKALAYNIKIDHKTNISNAYYNNIGGNFMDLVQLDSAEKYLYKALASKVQKSFILARSITI